MQRDLLPLIEGTIINTKHGNVNTEKILFIASGAFHHNSPSDLISELQGRLPIRVTLELLREEDFYRILTETEFNLIEQQVALLATEGVEVEFLDEAIHEIARQTVNFNLRTNIGARRLHHLVEHITSEISFDCEKYVGQKVTVDAEMVKKMLKELGDDDDMSKYIL